MPPVIVDVGVLVPIVVEGTVVLGTGEKGSVVAVETADDRAVEAWRMATLTMAFAPSAMT